MLARELVALEEVTWCPSRLNRSAMAQPITRRDHDDPRHIRNKQP